VDTATSTIYVGTDVGVFASSTASPNWTEVGPAPESGQAGYLPNTAVTALRMFNSSGTKKLRASTFGRGIWEFTLVAGPDFEFAIDDSSLTTFVGQNPTFIVTLQAQDGYNNTVNLSCIRRVTSPPPTCSIVPSSLTLGNSGATFSVSAGGPVGDYLFNAHGIGSDANKIAHDFALTLHVVDFNLIAPAPGSLTVNQSSLSGPTAFQVTASGAFNQVVALSCSGLPAGAACSFQPSGSVRPTSDSPIPVTLTISTGASTPPGTYTIAIHGTTTGGPTRTQSLTLTVNAGTTNNADFVIDISNPSLTVGPSESAVFNGTLKASGGYSSAVTLACAGSLPLSCAPSPATLTPTPAGAAFTVTATSDVQKTYDFNIVATGADAGHTTHSAAVELIVGFNFALNNNSDGQTIAAGQTASYNLDAVPLGNGSTFPSNLSLSCATSGMPALSTCSFTPSQVSAGSGDTNVRLNIVTTATSGVTARLTGMPDQLWYGLGFPLVGLVLALGGLKKPRSRTRLATLFVILIMLTGGFVACGGGGSSGGGNGVGGAGHPGTAPGNYTITVNGVVGSVTRSAQVVLTVQ